jgi:hypothetical protein
MSSFYNFLSLNKELLHCYGDVTINQYKMYDRADQKAVCLPERMQVESNIAERKVKLADFFTAAREGTEE